MVILVIFVVFSQCVEALGVDLVGHADEVFEVESVLLLVLNHGVPLLDD